MDGNWRLIVFCGLSPTQEALFIGQLRGMRISRIGGGRTRIKTRLAVLEGLHIREPWFNPKLLLKLHAERFTLSGKRITFYCATLSATEDENRLLEAKRKFRKSPINRILPHQIHTEDSKRDSELIISFLSRYEPNLIMKNQDSGGHKNKKVSNISGVFHPISIGLGLLSLVHSTMWKSVNLLPNGRARVFFWQLLTTDLNLSLRVKRVESRKVDNP